MTSQGPDREASYFPSIQRKYGQPIDYWLNLIDSNTAYTRHSDLVGWLKQEYGLGHGHANALVGYALRHRGKEE
jgi:hypothetical protein